MSLAVSTGTRPSRKIYIGRRMTSPNRYSQPPHPNRSAMAGPWRVGGHRRNLRPPGWPPKSLILPAPNQQNFLPAVIKHLLGKIDGDQTYGCLWRNLRVPPDAFGHPVRRRKTLANTGRGARGPRRHAGILHLPEDLRFITTSQVRTRPPAACDGPHSRPVPVQHLGKVATSLHRGQSCLRWLLP